MRSITRPIFFVVLCFVSASWASADNKPVLKIHMISGANEYKSEESLKILQRQLEEKYRVAVTASWVQDGARDLSAVKNIPSADLLIVFARRLKLPDEQMAVVRQHWENGKPIVGIRTASHAFGDDDNKIFDRKVMGGNYAGHYGREPVKVSVVSISAAKHPVLKEVGPIVSDKLYKANPLAKSVVLLQNGTIKSKPITQSVTWLHEYKGGRVFYTSLGTPEDFQNKNFLRMIINAIFWTTRQNPSTHLHKPQTRPKSQCN